MVRTATAGAVPRPSVAWPTALDGVATLRITNTATADNVAQGNIAAPVVLPVGGLPNNTQSWPVLIEGMLVAGPSPSGTLRVMLQSETAGVLVTVRAGSFLSWREVS